MLKKIGKKQLLGILTAAAIVVTTVGSFAVWDKLAAEKTSNEITITKPLETQMKDINLTKAVDDGTDNIVYTGTVEVNTINIPESNKANYKLALSSAIDGEAPAGVTATIGADAATATAASYTDESYVATTGGTYTVKVTAERASALNWDADKTIKVKVTATAEEKTSP